MQDCHSCNLGSNPNIGVYIWRGAQVWYVLGLENRCCPKWLRAFKSSPLRFNGDDKMKIVFPQNVRNFDELQEKYPTVDVDIVPSNYCTKDGCIDDITFDFYLIEPKRGVLYGTFATSIYKNLDDFIYGFLNFNHLLRAHKMRD